MAAPTDQQILQGIIGLLRRLAPQDVSDEHVARDFTVAVDQEQRVGEIYDNLLDQKKIDEFPLWSLVLIKKNADGTERRDVFPAPKRLEEAADVNEVVVYTAALGALVSPTVRALLMTHGYQFTWANAKRKPAKPLIIV